jgi:hypothetical protein
MPVLLKASEPMGKTQKRGKNISIIGLWDYKEWWAK